jgi:hypothetical protein
MFLNQQVWDDTVMEQRLLRFLADMLVKLRAGDLAFQDPPAAKPKRARSKPSIRQL